MGLEINSIRFRNYKSFTDDFHSIEDLKNINVFIGRNNSGKSSCVDIIQSLTDLRLFKHNNAEIRIEKELTYDDLDLIFNFSLLQGRKESRIQRDLDLYEHKRMEFEVQNVISSFAFQNVTDTTVFPESKNWNRIGTNIGKILSQKRIIRLNAERNIIPEKEDKEIELHEDGTGAVNVIQHILNYDNYDESIIRDDLLDAINEVIYPDSKFDGITVQKITDDKWEIFLYENDHRFALSKMGSGLKTIILVLLDLLVMPCINIGSIMKSDINDIHYENIIFAFEEIENNLHPALQRRLFEYIYRFSIEHDTTVLLTTHSHVAINLFAEKDEAQLYHINKENGKSSIHKVEDYITKCEILNDLDVRASDLLQSNGIIWVEGPSDKIYVKRWLELWGDNTLVEGVDYQFLYYGGRILSHFTADTDSKDDNLINILSTNRNSAIIIDSDICGKKAKINSTKKRIRSEFSNVGMFCWITDGKEIENYIPYQAINSAYNVKLTTQCKKNSLFPKYIKQVIGNNTFNKVSFAHRVIDHITDDNSSKILDLKNQIDALNKEIKKWNAK